MAQDFFRIYRGLELDDAVQFLSGSGAPGAAGDTAAAGVGSYYTDQANGDLYTKISSGTGTDKWIKQASQNYVQTMLATGVSWREPARVANTSLTSVPTGTPGSPVTVDSISISDGQRVLFTAISGAGGPNVYIYDQANGVFVEDVNNETDGDTVFVQEGTSADSTWQFNGTAWNTITTGTANAELGYIRDYVGKPTAGAVLPDYTGTGGIVVDNDTLVAAISKLDTEAGRVNSFIGKSAGADTPDYSSNTYVTDGVSLEAAIGELDAALTDMTKETVANGVVTLSDTVTAVAAEWDVWVRESATSTRVWAGKVFATQNGVTADHTTFGVLKLGGNLPVNASVALTGGANLVLTISTGSTNCDIRIKRITAVAL